MNNEYDSNLRHVDWNRGNPYVFRKEDFNELMNSDKLFARKFDESKDVEIVNMIYELILSLDEANKDPIL